MEKFIPYEKLSKRRRQEINAKRRGGWGALCPVTRKPPDPKAYNRKKARTWSDDAHMAGFFVLCYNYFAATKISLGS